MESAAAVLTLLAALGSGLVAGVFLAFSSFVMRALARQPAPAAVATMQAINVTVINPLFLGTFLGTALASLALAVLALVAWSPGASPLLLAGALLYLLGCLLVTLACNVPHNERLAAVAAADPAAAALWRRYVTEWTAWNHVRTLASLAAAAAFILALP